MDSDLSIIQPNNAVTGLNISQQTALTNTKVAITTAEVNLYGFDAYNSHATDWAFIQVFDALTANVTLGSTAATYIIPVPPNGGRAVFMPMALRHMANGLLVAATSTATGSSAPAATLTASFFTK